MAQLAGCRRIDVSTYRRIGVHGSPDMDGPIGLGVRGFIMRECWPYLDSSFNMGYIVNMVENPGGQDGGELRESVLPGEFEFLASSLSMDLADLQAGLPALIEKLRSLGLGPVDVKTKKRLIGAGEVVLVAASVGDLLFSLRPTGTQGIPQCTISKSVKGIVLKREDVSLETWLEQLSSQIATVAKRVGKDRAAVERALGLG